MAMYFLREVQGAVTQEVERDLSSRTQEQLKTMAYAGLAEEAGEVLGILKREMRDFDKDRVAYSKEHKVEELGDVLWYLAMVCQVEGLTLEEIWEYNRHKLEARYG